MLCRVTAKNVGMFFLRHTVDALLDALLKLQYAYCLLHRITTLHYIRVIWSSLSRGYNENKTEIKLKQNKRKTMFCFSEIVLFQFRFSVFTCETKR